MAEQADYVISQINTLPKTGPLQTEQLSARVRHLAIVPKIYFSGYQPDAVEMPKAPGMKSPMGGAFHSSIVAAAFLRRIPVKHAMDLFNAYVYAQLGYFDEFDKSYELQLASAEAEGTDLKSSLKTWTSDVFMHVPNRPKIHVAMDIAETALHRLHIETQAPATPPPDPLEGRSWPVYPEIAKRLGFHGSLTFRRKRTAVAPTVELDEFVAQSYARYANVDPKYLKQERVLHAIGVFEREGL
jgi:hypothetical protein